MRKSGKRIFRTYWYYTVKWRGRASVWSGKKARIAKKKAKQIYARYRATSSDPRSPKNCARLDSLSFRVKGAEAVMVRQKGGVRSGRATSRSRQGRFYKDLQYLAVDANGDIRPALVTLAGVPGYIAPDTSPSRMWLAPNGKIYAFWQAGSELVTDSSGGVTKCTFAEIDPANNSVNCLEETLEIEVEWGEYGPYDPGAEPVQFDAEGRVYYRGNRYPDGRRRQVLRRLDANGQKTDLLNDFQTIGRWRVLADGTVIISGATNLASGNNREWLRRINTSNGVRDLFNTAGSTMWMQLMPDGNLYFPFGGGIQRYEAVSDSITPFSESNFWTEYPTDIGGLRYSFNRVKDSAEAVYGVFGARWSSGDMMLVRMWPDYEVIDTSLGQIGLVAPVGDSAALVFGTRTENGNDFETLLVNLENGGERTVVPFDQDAKIEVYHLIDRGDGTALFDGLRFSDNRYVVGEIDLAAAEFEFINSSGQKLVELIGIP